MKLQEQGVDLCVEERVVKYISPPLQRTLLYPSKSIPKLRVSSHQGTDIVGGGASFMGMKNVLCACTLYIVKKDMVNNQ